MDSAVVRWSGKEWYGGYIVHDRDRILVVVMQKGIVLSPETDVMKLTRAQNKDVRLVSRFGGENCVAGKARHFGEQRLCTTLARQRIIAERTIGSFRQGHCRTYARVLAREGISNGTVLRCRSGNRMR